VEKLRFPPMASIFVGFVVDRVGRAEESSELVQSPAGMAGAVAHLGEKDIVEEEDLLINRCELRHWYGVECHNFNDLEDKYGSTEYGVIDVIRPKLNGCECGEVGGW
jgi:hypothetical protein